MNTRNIVLAILTLCIPILGGGLAAKRVADNPTEIRTIKTFREYKTKNGTSLTIDNKAYSEPDIYYTENGDGTYDAIRLTVTPIEVPAEMTAPYLNQATDHSILVCWKTKAINNNSIVKYGTDANHLDKQVSSSARQIATSYYWYNAQIEGLSPNTVYYYQCLKLRV